MASDPISTTTLVPGAARPPEHPRCGNRVGRWGVDLEADAAEREDRVRRLAATCRRGAPSRPGPRATRDGPGPEQPEPLATARSLPSLA